MGKACCLPVVLALIAGQLLLPTPLPPLHVLQLGFAPAGTNQLTPRRVEGLPQAAHVLFVAAGGDHSLAVLDTGCGADAGPAGVLQLLNV